MGMINTCEFFLSLLLSFFPPHIRNEILDYFHVYSQPPTLLFSSSLFATIDDLFFILFLCGLLCVPRDFLTQNIHLHRHYLIDQYSPSPPSTPSSPLSSSCPLHTVTVGCQAHITAYSKFQPPTKSYTHAHLQQGRVLMQ